MIAVKLIVDAPLGQVPDDSTLFAAPGAMLWRVWSIPPDKVLQELSADAPRPAPRDDHGEIRKDGFHKTDTIDYVFVLDGDIVLELDDSPELPVDVEHDAVLQVVGRRHVRCFQSGQCRWLGSQGRCAGTPTVRDCDE